MCLRNSVITVLLSVWDGQIPPEGDGAVVYANTATDRTDCLSFGVSSAAGGLVQFKVSDFGFESLMSPWLTTKHQNSQQSPGRNFNKLRLFWKEVGFCPISRFPLFRMSQVYCH